MSSPESTPCSVHDAQCGVRLLAYIYRILRARYHYGSRPALPCGLTPEDLAEKTLHALRTGARKINLARPFNQELFEAASSAVSSLHRLKEPRLTGHDLDEKAPAVASSDFSPAQAAETADFKATILDALRQHHAGKDDPDYQKVLTALERGLEKPADIAAFTGLPANRVSGYKQKLKKLYPALRAQLRKQGALQS